LKSFSEFIHELEELLHDTVLQAENQQWHHLPVESPEFQHYLRLMTWLEEVVERRRRYDYIKGGRPTRRSWRELQAWRTETDRLGRHPVQLQSDLGGDGQPNIAGGALSEGGHGTDDFDTDDNPYLRETTDDGSG